MAFIAQFVHVHITETFLLIATVYAVEVFILTCTMIAKKAKAMTN